ncbi:MAG: TrmH family RNA methyltransferase [Syntrophothermus sp.]
MLSKNQIKYITSLHLRKYRDLQRVFIAEGIKLVLELIKSHFTITCIYFDPSKAANATGEFLATGIPVMEITEEEMKKISTLASPGPVLALVKMPDDLPFPHTPPTGLVLVLDDIRDPGNLGTIIRVADWFGISHVITSPHSVDIYNPKVVQSTMGSLARVKVTQMPLISYLSALPEDTPVYGTFLEGKNIYREELDASGVIIIGNESKGISPPVASFVNRKIFIPPWAPEGHAESLNASMAAAIVCSEFRRRMLPG